MPKPPEDDERRSLREALADALSQLNLGDDAVEAVADQVRDALKSLSRIPTSGFGAGDFTTTPSEGGFRSVDRPDLRVVPDDLSEELTDEALHELGLHGRVVSVGTVRSAFSGPTLAEEGHIHLPLSSDALWQTLYRGQEFATYRLLCTIGIIEVAVDGDLTERLSPGQTVDIEARLIRVRRGDDALTSGRYARV